MSSKMYELWENSQKVNQHSENLKAAYCKSLADSAYAYAEYMTYRLNRELEDVTNQYKYDRAENAFLVKVIRPIYPEVPKSPAVILDAEIEVLIKYKDGKIKQMICPVTAFKLFIDPEKIDPSEYKF